MRRLLVAMLAGVVVLGLMAAAPSNSVAQTESCVDGQVIIELPVKVRDLNIGDCVLPEFPPAFRSFIIAYQNINPPVLTNFFSNAQTMQQRFDTQFETDGLVPVPETGNIFINDFAEGMRYQISYLGASPTCSSSVLTGDFVAPTISGPGEFQGVFWLAGRRVGIVRNVTPSATIDTVLSIRWGRLTRIPLSIFRRSSFALNIESFYRFLPRTLPDDFTLPAFC